MIRITPETFPAQHGKLATALTHWWHLCLSSLRAEESRPVSLPFPVRRGYSNRAPSLGLVLLWGILSLEKNHRVLTARGLFAFHLEAMKETALSHYGSSTFPNKPTHVRDPDTWSMTQARNKMFFTTNDWHRQHKAQAFSGLTKKNLKNFSKLQTSIAFPGNTWKQSRWLNCQLSPEDGTLCSFLWDVATWAIYLQLGCWSVNRHKNFGIAG